MTPFCNIFIKRPL